jgi:hypothetical protein
VDYGASQIKVLFQEGYADGERINYKSVIHANVFQAIKVGVGTDDIPIYNAMFVMRLWQIVRTGDEISAIP